MALLDNKQLEQMHPFFGTAVGRISAKVLKKVLSIDDFIHYYEISGADGSRGPDFGYNVCRNTGLNYQVAGYERLQALSGTPFITVSNHPYGGMDGIILIDLVGHICPGFKMIVNKFISILEYMDPSFISVKPTGKEKKAADVQSIRGILSALKHVQSGLPLGVFPAGAVSNLKWGAKEPVDRPWQEAIIKVIRKAGVPVVPIRFFDRNSKTFYRIGYLSRSMRVLRLPKEVINKGGKQVRLAIGEPISVEEQNKYTSIEEFSDFLRSRVYDMPLPLEFVYRNDLVI